MSRGRRRDVAAGGEQERHVAFEQGIGDRPRCLASAQVNVENRDIEPATGHAGQSSLDRVSGAGDAVAQRIDEILQHHGDEGFVFDDQDR